MTLLTPGLHMLWKHSPTLFGPPFVVFLGSKFYKIPVLILILSYILSTPLLIAFMVLKDDRSLRREIVKMGAQPMPMWSGKWFGNADIAMMWYDSWKNGYPGDKIDDVFEEIGTTFLTRIFGVNQIWTIDPRNIKAILATDFDGYVKGKQFIEDMESVLGNGIFNSDGEMWKFHRGITRPHFRRDRISDLQVFAKYADNAISQAQMRLRQGYAIDFQDMLSRFTLDTTTAFLFGSCVDSLSAGLPYPESVTGQIPQTNPSDIFARAFTNAQRIIGSRAWIGPVWPLLELFGDKPLKDRDVIDAFIRPILTKALDKKKANEAAGVKINPVDQEDTLLMSLLSQTDDFELLRDETLNILIAGRDTMSSLLTFTIYCFTQHPDVMEKARREIINTIGLKKAPTYEDIKDMKYLRAVLNETLRLFPPVPFNVRRCIKNTTWPSNKPGEKPYFIADGSACIYSVLLMHRNKDLWGPDALEFDPERFIDERLHKYLTPNPFIFLPFNAGPRLCLGQQYAYNQMSFMLIRLLQTFDSVTLAKDAQPAWSLPPTEWKQSAAQGKRRSREELWPKMHLTLYANGGLWVRMKEGVNSEN